MRKIMFIFLVILIQSCKVDNSNDFPNYERIRTNKLKLNNEAEDALNKISKILDGTDAKRDLNSTSAQSSEIFFNLNKEEQTFYIRRTNYRNYQFNDVSSYTDFKIPINELSVDNIELLLDNMPIFGGDYASINITSKFNNEEAFLECRTDRDKDGKSTTKDIQKCGKFSFIVSQSNGVELKKALIVFLNNYKK
ncbi:hypothetical protein [Flavobacterium yafengii]|uniref:hypothetical protein n=1 Tax=Flavobacterium yafengii TaxID=3041253 RepID=UPI0024A89FA6|nr:hypothetical protein [Flavobacterium yafengii]MDI5899340.1 hypothetical protein [Flavobacterium yafengii]